jgi:hypothetical protein
VITARPPRTWEVQTVAVLAAVGATALLTMVLLVTDLGLRSSALSAGTGAVSPLVATVARDPYLLDFLGLVLVVAYVGTFYWWRGRTTELLRRVNAPTGVLAHWGVFGWYFCLGLSFAVRIALDGPTGVNDLDSVATALAYDALALAFRLIGLALLLIGVWQIREQVRQTVAESGVAFRMSDLGSLVSAPTPAVPLPPLVRTEIAKDTLPPADEAFWTRVSEQAAAAGADLALLETTDSAVHRWFLVPATGDTSDLRATVPLGAVVTVFAEPPAADFSLPATEAETETDEFYGFLEDAESGALWFQSVRPNRVPAFLARARTARRWALYPVTSPTARSAVTLTAMPTP